MTGSPDPGLYEALRRRATRPDLWPRFSPPPTGPALDEAEDSGTDTSGDREHRS